MKILNFIKINEKQIKNDKEENGKNKLKLTIIKIRVEGREVQLSKMNFLPPNKFILFLNFSYFLLPIFNFKYLSKDNFSKKFIFISKYIIFIKYSFLIEIKII